MKIGMLFPGYGSQFVGMGKELYDDSRIMQEYFEEASNCLNMNFVKLCFASSDSELMRMENAYPAIFLISTSIAALLKQEGITLDVVAGYNLGEYAAIHTVGGFSMPDGLYLLAKFQSFYQEALSGMWVAGLKVVGIEEKELKQLCMNASDDENSVSIASYDLPLQYSIMGSAHAIEKIRELLRERKDVKVNDQSIEMGLHSSLMDSVALNFKIYLEKVDFKDIAVPLITNADAKRVTHGDSVKSSLIKQIYSPLLWRQSMELLNECDLVIEVGPGTSLTKMVQAQYPEKKCIAINKKSDLEELKEYREQQSSI